MADLEGIRAEFFRRALRLNLVPGNPDANRMKIVNLYDFFFTSILSESRSRVLSLIQYYNKERDGLGARFVSAASNAASDDTLPELIRKLYRHLSYMLTLDHPRETPYTILMRHIRLLQFLRTYEQYIDAAQRDVLEIVKLLSPPTQGFSWANQAFKFFADNLGLNKDRYKKLDSYLNYGRGL